ncbi:MAG: choice-of-anchor L domain-containing protein [Pirellulaceae bacterium]
MKCPEVTTVSFEYVFASEEYNEYVNSSFNDVFGFFLNGSNIALLPGTSTPVTINNVNGGTNSSYFKNNDPSDFGIPTPYGTEYDGFTQVLEAVAVDLQPGVVHHLKIAIADASDSALDSAVFLRGQSLGAGSADLAVTGSDDSDPVEIGESLTYSITVSNTGPSDASGVVAIDELPAGVVFQSATVSQGTVTESGGIVTAELGGIASSSSATLSITVTAPNTTGIITSDVTVVASQFDPIKDNNKTSIVTTVVEEIEPPYADAGGPYIGEVDEVIRFDASNSVDPDGFILLYEWDWNNDGAFDHISTQPTAERSFGQVAMSTVAMRTTHADGTRHIDWADLTVYIPHKDPNIYGSPLAEFEESHYTGSIGESIEFSVKPSSSIVKYEWDWNGDGKFDEVTNVARATHIYSEEFLGEVFLRATDSAGKTYADTVGVSITFPPAITGSQLSDNVFASISSSSVGFHGVTMTFDGSASFSSNAAIALYEWDWDGDGVFDTATSDSAVDHVFANGFLGTIALRVTDANGLANISYKDITIF